MLQKCCNLQHFDWHCKKLAVRLESIQNHVSRIMWSVSPVLSAEIRFPEKIYWAWNVLVTVCMYSSYPYSCFDFTWHIELQSSFFSSFCLCAGIKIGSVLCTPVHACALHSECAWNVGYICHCGASFFWGCTSGGVYVPCIYTLARWELL